MGEYEDITVSVIVPVYKCEKYIGACIESIVAQTHSNLEIILVLDGAADNCPTICKAFAARDSRIVVIEQENQGVSVARNNGMKTASGKWIMFVDGDDYIEKNAVEVMLKAAVEIHADIVISRFCFDTKGKKTKGSFFPYERYVFTQNNNQELLARCVDDVIGVPWAKLYRTVILKSNRITFIPGLIKMEDLLFNLYAFSQSTKTVLIPDYLYCYRQNTDSVTKSFDPNSYNNSCAVLRELELFINKTKKNYLRKSVQQRTIEMIGDMIKYQYAPPNNKLKRKKKIEEIKRIINDDGSIFKNNLGKIQIGDLKGRFYIIGFFLKYKLYAELLLLAEIKYKYDQKSLKNSAY